MRKTDRNRMHRHLSMAWSLFVCLLLSHRGSAEDLPANQVVKDLLSGTARLQAAEIRQSTWECIPVYIRGGGKPGSGTYLVKYLGASVLVNAAQTTKSEHYRTINSGVETFSMESKTSGRTWVLRNYQKRKPDDAKPLTTGDDQFVICPLTAVSDHSTILQLLDKESFTATRARRVAKNRIELDYDLPDGTAKGLGTLTLDPDLDWLVIRSTNTTTSPGGASGHTAFSRDAVRDGDRIQVKSISYEAEVKGKPQYGSKSTYTFKLLAPETVDPAEFTLEYYNLSAPESVVAYEDRPKFNWILWGSVGAICIVLSLGLGWIEHRRRTT